jgi:peptide deformylase
LATREIHTLPDPILRKKCKAVSQVDDGVRALLADMAETMYASPNGAGLAANQVGVLKRLVVLDMGQGLVQLVNPRIVHREGKQEVLEGCLSLPGRWGRVIRPRMVTVEALDQNGAPLRLVGTGDLAKCFCHEIDHLDGILFCDRVTQWVPME